MKLTIDCTEKELAELIRQIQQAPNIKQEIDNVLNERIKAMETILHAWK